MKSILFILCLFPCLAFANLSLNDIYEKVEKELYNAYIEMDYAERLMNNSPKDKESYEFYRGKFIAFGDVLGIINGLLDKERADQHIK